MRYSTWLRCLAGLLVIRVTVGVVSGYGEYFPPDFTADFLLGREAYFHGWYRGAFYVHLVVGPSSLLLGLALMSDRLRQAAPAWHARLGRLQLLMILGLLVPSGLAMSRHAMTGRVAAAGLACLAVATTYCAASGWRTARARRFAEHRRWMTRTFLLLCSAVVIRLMGGAATVAGFDDPAWYSAATWASWLVPSLAYELVGRQRVPGSEPDESGHHALPNFTRRRPSA